MKYGLLNESVTFSYAVRCLKVCVLMLSVITGYAVADEEDGDLNVVLKTTLDMRCFPPTNPANTPPCPVPVGLSPELVAANPQGRLGIKVFDNDTATFSLKLSGLNQGMVLTAWFIHFPPNQPPPHPVFAPVGPGLPSIALADTPLASAYAKFSDGLSIEPNQLLISDNGVGRLKSKLDYNPLKSGQVPLVNNMTPVNQAMAPVDSKYRQTECCADFPTGAKMEPVGGSLLRKFDPVTGFQLKDDDGRPVLLRSPGRPVAVAVFVHTDGTTSGVFPGIPTPPFLLNPPATTGTFYLLGLFPLGNLGLDE